MAIITYLTRIRFDFGAIAHLAEELGLLAVRRPLVVSDPGVAAAGLLDRALGALGDIEAAGVFTGTPANPTEGAVLQALALWRDSGADGIVAIGGGSAMDLGKAVALLATHEGPLAGYMLVEGGAARIGSGVAPVVAVPTTAGTGSEVGRGAVVVLEDGRKLALISPHLIPRLALCDPELTLGLPPGVTAGTGMDAVAHCIETFLSPAVNPPAEAIALDGLARAFAHLPRAYANGSDRQARWEMMMAAMMGAMAFQKGLGAVHAMSHPLGALGPPPLHHGTLNAVLLPAVLRFNRAHVGDKMQRLAAILGADPPEAIAAMNRRLGLPAGLAVMGVPRAALPAIAEAATRDHCAWTNPRPATAEDYGRMLAEAY